MGDFEDTVLTILDAFKNGIAIIKSLRGHRKNTKAKIAPAVKSQESRLRRSLKKSKHDVKLAYTQDVENLGSRFLAGDDNALSSLKSILFRLNTGFVSIMDRFTKGKSTRADYQTLVGLSNSSRLEAIETFSKLSTRLSRTSITIPVTSDRRSKSYVHIKGGSSRSLPRRDAAKRVSRRGAKSTPKSYLESTLVANDDSNLVRGLGNGTNLFKLSLRSAKKENEIMERNSSPRNIQDGKCPPDRSQVVCDRNASRLSVNNPTKRISVFSYSSDSTKLGEIPEAKWATAGVQNGHEVTHSTAFPLAPWREPDKTRSRFMRLFRR